MLLHDGFRQGEADVGLLVTLQRVEGLVYKGLFGTHAIVRDLDRKPRPVFGDPGAQPQSSTAVSSAARALRKSSPTASRSFRRSRTTWSTSGPNPSARTAAFRPPSPQQ